jgi:nucleoside-triphosphatase THEP1
VSAVLLVGDRQSGKTTTCQRLAEAMRARGLPVAGVIAPAVQTAGRRVGYDVLDLATGRATRLATLAAPGAEQIGRFHFLAEGLALGRDALASAITQSCPLTIVDEVGPLELAGGGWACHLDPLASGPRLALFTVRRDLATHLAQRWSVPPNRVYDVHNDTSAIIAAILELVAS